jgi:DNA modification methylase
VVEPLIANLTKQGELVVDPSEGAGLWGDVASKLGRRYIGCDIVKGGSTRVVLPP